MNRPDFMIRQLEYYAKVKNSHPIYIGDAGSDENKKKLQPTIEKLSKHLIVHYYSQPENCNLAESRLELYGKVKEEYCVFSADDDYQIPNSLTKCAEFLKENPDYSSASGYSVSFRLVNNGVYGESKRLAEYPRYQTESSTAAQRLISLMSNFTITDFSVHRVKQMIRCWQPSYIKDKCFAWDVLPTAMSVVLGKSKIIDCLSLIRQIDNPKQQAEAGQNSFEWITLRDFQSSYGTFCDILAKEISAIDSISIDEARKAPRQALWSYLRIWLPYEYKKIYGIGADDRKKLNGNLLRKFKFHLGQKLPWLKKLYLRTAPALSLYDKVMQPLSPYYKDFKPIFDSFSGKYRNS